MAKDNEKYAYLNRLTTEQLEELLRIDIENLEPSDEDAVFGISGVIDQRENDSPTSRIPDVDKAWAEFQEYYDMPEGADVSLYPYIADSDYNSSAAVNLPLGCSQHKRSLRRWLKQGLAAVIAVGVVFGGMVVAQAAGIDVFGAIGHWTEEVFHFIPLENENGEPTGGNSGEYIPESDILREKLSSVGIDDDLVPVWYPEGFTYREPEIMTSCMSTLLTLNASGPDDLFLTVDIIKYAFHQLLSRVTFEKDASDIEYYSNSKQDFYILSNLNTITGGWADGVLVQQITGNISRDDIKKMIDSIGGGIS